MLDAHRVARYYGALASRLRRRRRGLEAFTAFGSTGAVSSLLLSFPDWAASAFCVATAAAAIWSLVSRHGDHAALAARAADEMGRVADRWQLLWADVDALAEDAARARLAELLEAMGRCAEGVPAELSDDSRLNERCAEETYAVMRAQYLAAAA